MRLLDKARAYARVMRRPSYRRPPELVRLLSRRPQIALAVSTYETALLASGRVEGRLKALAAIKAGSLVGCPF
jgi:hypothetical protein